MLPNKKILNSVVCDYSESQKEIREICLRLLTRREHSQLELLNKLTLRGFDQSETTVVVDDLSEQGWQSNQRFFESYVRHRVNRGYGPIKISFELLQRGVEEASFESVVSEIVDDWNELLTKVYKKKYSDQNTLTNNEWQSRSRFLKQRGFSGEMIKTLFNQLNLKLIYS